MYHDVREALAKGDIGEVKFVQVDFGFDMVTQNWIRDGWDGVMPTIGGYPIQLAMMVFSGEKPLKIEASGKIQDGEGVLWMYVIGIGIGVHLHVVFIYCRVASIRVTILLGQNFFHIVS